MNFGLDFQEHSRENEDVKAVTVKTITLHREVIKGAPTENSLEFIDGSIAIWYGQGWEINEKNYTEPKN